MQISFPVQSTIRGCSITIWLDECNSLRPNEQDAVIYSLSLASCQGDVEI